MLHQLHCQLPVEHIALRGQVLYHELVAVLRNDVRVFRGSKHGQLLVVVVEDLIVRKFLPANLVQTVPEQLHEHSSRLVEVDNHVFGQINQIQRQYLIDLELMFLFIAQCGQVHGSLVDVLGHCLQLNVQLLQSRLDLVVLLLHHSVQEIVRLDLLREPLVHRIRRPSHHIHIFQYLQFALQLLYSQCLLQYSQWARAMLQISA